MKRSIIIISLFVILIAFGSSCKREVTGSFTFAFYNVENLFDTIDDPAISDESYLPDSKVAWNTERYNHKLENISKVLMSLKEPSFSAIIGLCEVENLDVVKELSQHPNIAAAGYKIIHKNSPDERGIDVALFYQPQIYQPVKNTFIKPDFKGMEANATRDILYSKGLINNVDTIHIFVNHWVSRWGGQEATEPYRMAIAAQLKSITDSILNVNPDANILIAGDLNDNPIDKSLVDVLKAKPVGANVNSSDLYNLALKLYESDTAGTLYYKSWDVFDQIIVSGALLAGEGNLKVASESETVFKEDWMLYQPKEGPARPSRTASGRNYFGGYSDHLPVMIDINYMSTK